MKALFTLLLSLVLTKLSAQNFELKYLTYTGTHYQISITNHLSCAADMRISWMRGGFQSDSMTTVTSNATWIVELPAKYIGGSEIKIKSDAPCSSNGWVSLTVPQTLTLNDNRIIAPKKTNVPEGKVRVVSVVGYLSIEMSEAEYQQKKRTLPNGSYLIIRSSGVSGLRL